ncbi:MAG TPA: adenosine deaminase [Clostridiales bacterium]|nr:adenosine deaminase [Clostridiales bacterium]
MIDLHLHLDGSLTPREVLFMAKLSGVSLFTQKEEDLLRLMTFDGRGSLNDYLQKFELPLSVMQNDEAVEFAVTSLGDRLFAQGYTYAEVRFAPVLHTQKGVNAERIVQGALKGVSKTKLPMKPILCCMRGRSLSENLLTVELAAEYKGKGVCGVDLAGAEALYPTENYKEVFSLAAKLGLNVTIHAGEAAGEESVKAALDFGAKRIGHGVAIKSKEVSDRVKANGVLIECCPTSNLQTGAVDRMEDHPIKRFMEAGIPVALCSDNMTVSATSVPAEWKRVKAAFGFEENVFGVLTQNAFAHRF